MSESYLRKTITLNNNEKWYICDQTNQNGNIYYLAIKLDENNEPGDESKIFKKVQKDERVFLDDKIDEKTFKYLTAIFITDFNNNYEKIVTDLNNEEA